MKMYVSRCQTIKIVVLNERTQKVISDDDNMKLVLFYIKLSWVYRSWWHIKPALFHRSKGGKPPLINTYRYRFKDIFVYELRFIYRIAKIMLVNSFGLIIWEFF